MDTDADLDAMLGNARNLSKFISRPGTGLLQSSQEIEQNLTRQLGSTSR
jgi:hypothetical protein